MWLRLLLLFPLYKLLKFHFDWILYDLASCYYDVAWMYVAPVKVVDIADVAKQGVFVLRAQSCTGLVVDALQVVLKEMRKEVSSYAKHISNVLTLCFQSR